MAKSGIYAIANTETGDEYVGSAVKLSYRWSRHKWALNAGRHHNTILQRAWDKHGSGAFAFVVLEECGVAELLEFEQKWISARRPRFNIAKHASSRRGTTNSAAHNAAIAEKAKIRWADAEFKAKATASIRAAVALRDSDPAKAKTARLITAFGETKTLSQWARDAGLTRECLAWRLNQGIAAETALQKKGRRPKESR